MIMAVCVIRGLGFGITVVAGGSLTAALIPAERRGEGLALSGLVSGVPALAALPLGVLAALRTPALLRPGLMFAVTTTAAGIVVTFLPIADHQATGGLTALALFAQTASATLSRCVSGWYSDRHGPGRLIIPALATASSGMLMLTATGKPAAVLAGCVLFGAGFGVAQNTTLSLMYTRVPASGYAAVSAVWNIAYDAGMGLGAAAFGLLAGGTGYPAAFAITSAAMLAALAPALRDRRLAAG
jgi:predicted MFS family arabinose efflux permease